MTNGTIDHARFMAMLTERFPAIANSIDDCSHGLLHPEMGTLASATQAAIDQCDKATILQHFAFVDEVFRDANAEVENAVYVSYLENLRFDGRTAGPTNARELLPTRLRQALAKLDAHWEKMFPPEKP